MAIEESKIIDLIASYKKREEECMDAGGVVNGYLAGLYETMIKDLESLLPRKTLADLGVSGYGDLTGTIVECGGRRGVLLNGRSDMVTLFIFADTCVMYADPTLVYLLNEDRIWDETGALL